MHTPLGYDPHHVMTVGIPVHDGTYKTWAERNAYFDQLHKKVAAVPGVTLTAISSNATPPNNGWRTGVEVLGQAPRDDQKAGVNFADPGLFPHPARRTRAGPLLGRDRRTQRSPLRRHQSDLRPALLPQGRRHRTLYPCPRTQELSTIQPHSGRRHRLDADRRRHRRQAHNGLRKPISPEIFLPSTLNLRMYTQILVRSDVPPLSLLHSIAAQINSVRSRSAGQQLHR